MPEAFKRAAAMRAPSPRAATGACAALAVAALIALAVGCDRKKDAIDPEVVPGKYIVSIEVDGHDAALATDAGVRDKAIGRRNQVRNLARARGGEVVVSYDAVLIGFSAQMSPELADQIDALDDVRVAPAHRVRLSATQSDPPYGLDRISERGGCLNRTYTYNQTGKGVHVYVIDTGILAQHPEFETAPGQSRVSGTVFDEFNDGQQDDNGHGTHVAGTIGGKTFGVAKEVTLHSARVFKHGIETDTGLLIGAIDWVTQDAGPHLPYVVVNMSLNSAPDPDLDRAVSRSIRRGLTYIVAAGNVDRRHRDRNACHSSPAGVPKAVTVGATHPADDSIATFSHVGQCVDLFAPGVYVMSARNDLSGQPRIKSGTSMATAHVSGVAALYLQTRISHGGSKATPSDVWKAVRKGSSFHPGSSGWKGIQGSLHNSPNRLSHWGSGSADGTQDGESCPAQ